MPGCEVPLDQLLSLEEGDVIPLDARVGEPALVAVELAYPEDDPRSWPDLIVAIRAASPPRR